MKAKPLQIGLTLFALLAFFVGHRTAHADDSYGVVIGSNVHVRTAPTVSSGIQSKLNRFDLVRVVSQDREWVRIEYCPTRYWPRDYTTCGYVYKDWLEIFDSPKAVVPLFGMSWDRNHYDVYGLFYIYAPKMIPLSLLRYPQQTIQQKVAFDTLEIVLGRTTIGEFAVPVLLDQMRYVFRQRWGVQYQKISFYADVDTLPYLVCLPKGTSPSERNTLPIRTEAEDLKEELLARAGDLFLAQGVDSQLLPKMSILNFIPTRYNDDSTLDIMGSVCIPIDFDHKHFLNCLLSSGNQDYEVTYHSYLAIGDYRSAWHIVFYGTYDFLWDGHPELIGYWDGCDSWGVVVIGLHDNTWETTFLYRTFGQW